jgi:hypothetical protein
VLRSLLWRFIGLLALVAGLVLVAWLLEGGPGRLLRGRPAAGAGQILAHLTKIAAEAARSAWSWSPAGGLRPLAIALLASVAVLLCLASMRMLARRRRCYVRLRIEPHRTDQAGFEALVRMFDAVHRRNQRRWWRRLISGQPSMSLEVHHDETDGLDGRSSHSAWMALTCLLGDERMAEAALRTAYPNCRLTPLGDHATAEPAALVRLKKDAAFIRRVKKSDRFEHEREPPMNRLLTVIGACQGRTVVQLALVPAPVLFERYAARRFRSHENRLARERRAHLFVRDRSMLDEDELRGGLELQHRPLFFVELRVLAGERRVCERIASELRVESAETGSSNEARRSGTGCSRPTGGDCSGARAIRCRGSCAACSLPASSRRCGTCRRSTISRCRLLVSRRRSRPRRRQSCARVWGRAPEHCATQLAP